jgi:hypothetical protein
MLCVSAKNAVAPFDVTQLYWVQNKGLAATNPAAFFFASADGSRLVPAIYDEERFLAALTDAVGQFADYPFVFGLQQLLDILTASAEPPAPVYPAAGDADVSGSVLWVVQLTKYIPDPWFPPPWVDLPPIWVGVVLADIAANGYSTPPANSNIQFQFLFRSTSEICAGQAAHFDIAQGKFALFATNITLD